MATIYDSVSVQYADYTNKLANKLYRQSEVAETITVKSSALISMYVLSAMENNSTHMAEALAALATLYETTLTPPSLIISGLETEATSEQSKAVTAGLNTITFPISLSVNTYALFVTATTSDGNFNSYRITTKLTSGFTIYVAEAGYLDYRAIIV